jgi:hypothetical protein
VHSYVFKVGPIASLRGRDHHTRSGPKSGGKTQLSSFLTIFLVLILWTIVAACLGWKIWHGDGPIVLSADQNSIDSIREKFNLRLGVVSAVSPFVPISLMVLWVAGTGLQHTGNVGLKFALYIVEGIGALAFIGAGALLFSLYFTGRPKVLVPPQFRDKGLG